MKKIILCLVTFTLLSACGSDDKAAPAASGGPQKTDGKVPAIKCPVFNGVYAKSVSVPNGDGTTTTTEQLIEIYTEIRDGFYHYRFSRDGEFKPADGELKDVGLEGKTGKFSLSCDSESVIFAAQAYGDEDGVAPEKSTIQYSKPAEGQLKVETVGAEVASLKGLYTFKADSTPAPAPETEPETPAETLPEIGPDAPTENPPEPEPDSIP